MRLDDLLALLRELPANASVRIEGRTGADLDIPTIDTVFYNAHNNTVYLYT